MHWVTFLDRAIDVEHSGGKEHLMLKGCKPLKLFLTIKYYEWVEPITIKHCYRIGIELKTYGSTCASQQE